MWFSNLKIKAKVLFGFIIVIIMVAILVAVSAVSLLSVDKDYSNLIDATAKRRDAISDLRYHFNDSRRIVSTAILMAENAGSYDNYHNQEIELDPKMLVAYEAYKKATDIDIFLTTSEKAGRHTKIDNVMTMINNQYKPIVDQIFVFIKAGDIDLAKKEFDKCTEIARLVNDGAQEISTIAEDRKNFMNKEVSEKSLNTVMLLVGIGVLIIIVSVSVAMIIADKIKKSVALVANAADSIAAGNFNITVGSNGKDEIADLSNSLLKVKNIVGDLIYEINKKAEGFAEGDIEASINLGKFEGEYKKVAESIESMTGGIVGELLYMIEVLTEFGDGNFGQAIKVMPGKKIVLTNSLNSIKTSIQTFIKEINGVIGYAVDGELDHAMKPENYKGDFNKMANGVNDLLNAIVVPVREAMDVMNELTKGNLSASVKGDYKGNFAEMKNAINSSLTTIASYIKEIGEVLRAMSRQDLTVGISREYVGDFDEIKNDINMIISTFNKVISEISSATEQVASGARQISAASMNLAQGTTEQSTSVQDLTITIDNIYSQTETNTKNAEEANTLAHETKQSAEIGNKEMQNMLVAMEEISTASEDISKIIKVIDDIAFQTNILALNAAVEAARAGQYGKGFAVVAEEVRSLAARSQEAAKNTSELIDGTVKKVGEGSEIANKTAESLGKIVTQINKISSIIDSVAESSVKQADAIQNINIGISQINVVTQSNSSTSEEQASAAQELSSQSEIFRGMVGKFRL